MKFCAIVACENNGGIGKNECIPWHCSIDLKHFQNTTKGTEYIKNVLVMGRCTFESICSTTLGKNRLTVVLTRGNDFTSEVNDVITYNGSLNPLVLKNFLRDSFSEHTIGTVFYCGGQTIYEQALVYAPFFDSFLVTHLDLNVEHCDRYFDLKALHKNCFSVSCNFFESKNEPSGKIVTYEANFKNAKNKEEVAYLQLCKHILLNGEKRDDRTGVGTYSLFGQRLEFSLYNGVLPCLTSKKLAIKSVIKELLWFISGSTNSKVLENQGVKIWTGNTSREFLDKRGLSDLQEGDIGAGYGFQWRHFGADYKGMDECYDEQGIDQLSEIVNLIKNDPFSRRIILTAWNPAALSSMALPPCHMMAQFYVSAEGELSCQMYQRSCDVFLGIPFNIMSYSLLTHMIAHVCGLRASKLIMCLGDTHIYQNHVEQVLTQLKNVPNSFPILKLSEDVKSIFDFKMEHINIMDYQSYKAINAPMAV